MLAIPGAYSIHILSGAARKAQASELMLGLMGRV